VPFFIGARTCLPRRNSLPVFQLPSPWAQGAGKKEKTEEKKLNKTFLAHKCFAANWKYLLGSIRRRCTVRQLKRLTGHAPKRLLHQWDKPQKRKNRWFKPFFVQLFACVARLFSFSQNNLQLMDRIYPGEGGGIWFHTILNAQGKFFHSLVAYKWGQASPAAQRFFFAKNWSKEMEKFWPKVNWIVKGDGCQSLIKVIRIYLNLNCMSFKLDKWK